LLLGTENVFHAITSSSREQSRKGLGMFMLVSCWG
jgi:hypothetical protein